MKRSRVLLSMAILLLAGHGVQAAPIFGVSAFVATDAGNARQFQGVPFDPNNNVSTTGLIMQSLDDIAFGGKQHADTTAYASIGALGGVVHAESVSGASPSSAQASNDLSWYFDWTPTGPAGSTVQVQFSQLFEGGITATSPDGRGYSGGIHATTFVGGSVLSDWSVDSSTLGGFMLLGSRIFEFTVGDVVHLSSRLTVGGRAELDAGISADAFNTSKLFIDVLTPGAGYNSQDFLFPTLLAAPGPGTPPSGNAVPEPPAMVLSLMALGALGWVRRRSR